MLSVVDFVDTPNRRIWVLLVLDAWLEFCLMHLAMNRVVKVQNLKLALVVDSGLSVGSVYPLQEGRQVIGRRIDASIPIDDTKVSRDHALVDFRNGFYYLVDLGSTNGTYINGRRLQNASRLNLGDHLRIGNSVFRVDLVKKAQENVSKQWHESTNVELNAFVKPEIRMESSVETIMVQDPKLLPAKKKNVMGTSIPRWFYLVEPRDKSFMNKKQGLLLVLLISSLLVISAIFVNFGTSRSL